MSKHMRHFLFCITELRCCFSTSTHQCDFLFLSFFRFFLWCFKHKFMRAITGEKRILHTVNKKAYQLALRTGINISKAATRLTLTLLSSDRTLINLFVVSETLHSIYAGWSK